MATTRAGLLCTARLHCSRDRLVQPWIIYGFMRTRDAVTPMPGLVVPFTTFTTVYLRLAVIVIFLLRRQFMETHPRWINAVKKEPLSHA